MKTLPSACPLDCPDACSLEVKIENGRVKHLGGTTRNPFTQGFICSKVAHYDEHLHRQARILRPALRRGTKGSGDFAHVSWEEALERIADKIREVRSTKGGEAILPFSYGGSNGLLTHGSIDARLFHRLGASRLLRTICAAPTGAAATGLYGKMLGTALADYEHSRLIVIWGTNPSSSGIHLVPIVRRAIKAGTKLVVVDPRRTPLAKLADMHLRVHPGTDLSLALSVIHWFFEENRADLSFLERHASEVEELRKRTAPWDIERAAELSRVPAEDILAFARLYADSDPAVIRLGWGLERNRNGGSAAAAVLALPAVAGKFGRRGGGYTMSNSRAWTLDPQAACNAPEPKTRRINMNRLGRELCERSDPSIDVLFCYNVNALSTVPDQEKVRRGLAREDLFTVVYDQVMTDTARYADILLPATTFLEHHDFKPGYGAAVLNRIHPVTAPLGESRPNYEVFAELCLRLGLSRSGEPEDPDDLCRAAIETSGDRERIGEALDGGGPFTLAKPGPVPFVDEFPHTVDGRIHLVPEALDREAQGGLYAYRDDPASERFPLALISPASSRTISSSLGQLLDRTVPVEIHPEDARARGIEDGGKVRIFNELGEVRCDARINPDLREGTVMLPKGLWSRHTRSGTTANALVPDSLTDLGQGACFNDSRVEIQPC
ncbi:MAG: molybdopterin-dependent oxidoreductase [Planctomycetota bacterium]